jgi:hypothetical protein
MKNLLILVLLFAGSSVWAQDTATYTPQETPTVLDTPVPTMTAVTGTSWGSAGTSSAVNTPSITGTESVNPTPSGTPSALPKPPAFVTASTPVPSNPVGEHFVVQLDGGLVMPISGAAATVYGSGFGLDGRIGYAFDDVFSVGLELGFYDLGVTSATITKFGFPTGATSDTSHIPVLFDMQIYFGDSGAPIQPYLTLAGGLSFDSDNIQGAPYKTEVNYSWANFELDPAVGVAFMLDRTTNIFVQTKWAMDFDDNSSSNAESADSPIMLIPFQAGLSFSL